MGDVAAFVGHMMGLTEPNAGAIRAIANEAQNFPNSVEVLVDALEQKVKNTREDKALLASWYLIDAMAKQTKFGRSRVAPVIKESIVHLASLYIPWHNPELSAKYSRLVLTWKSLFGDDVVEQILNARDHVGVMPSAEPAMPEVAAEPMSFGAYPEPPRSGIPEPRGGGGPRPPREPMQPQGKLAAYDDSFEMQRIPDRPPAQDEIAPPMPIEIPVAVPRPAPGAPMGHVKAPPVDHHQNYIRERGSALKHILANAKRKRHQREQGKDADDEEDGDKLDPAERNPKKLRAAMKRKISRLVVKHRFVAKKVDEAQWPQMPTSFPRCPETDVQVGNYVDGVIFIRDAISECGGALELTRLNTKLPEIRSVANRVKSVREFIDIHTPTTFQVTREEGRVIVRLSDQSPPKLGDTPSWLGTSCPDCGKVVPGHNLPKHRGSKGCIALQMLLGREGKGKSPVAQLANMCFRILQCSQESGDPGVDDDDIEHLGHLIERSADRYRFKFARKSDLTPMVRAVRAVHSWWLLCRDADCSASVNLTQDDVVMVKFLERVGKNMYRLPLSYLDFGEFEAMCGPFVSEFIAPPPKPARFGSTKIRPKECPSPGLVFCDSDRDSDNPPDSDRESDEEVDKEPDVTAPLTMSQVLSTVGTSDQGNKRKLLQMAASTIEWKQSNPIRNLHLGQTVPQIAAAPGQDLGGMPAPRQEFTFQPMPGQPQPQAPPPPPGAPAADGGGGQTTYF